MRWKMTIGGFGVTTRREGPMRNSNLRMRVPSPGAARLRQTGKDSMTVEIVSVDGRETSVHYSIDVK